MIQREIVDLKDQRIYDLIIRDAVTLVRFENCRIRNLVLTSCRGVSVEFVNCSIDGLVLFVDCENVAVRGVPGGVMFYRCKDIRLQYQPPYWLLVCSGLFMVGLVLTGIVLGTLL